MLDEGYTWLVGSAPDPSAFLDHLARWENTPPLYYLLLSPLPLHDEVWVRLPALVAGVLCVPVLGALVGTLLGRRAGLLAALALAVLPYAVAVDNLARGFSLCTLGLLITLLAAARLSTGGARSWWWAYAGGSTLALWSEYYAALTLLPLLALLVVRRPRPVREILAFGPVPFLTLAPWAGQLHRSLSLNGETKVLPAALGLGPARWRDELPPLFFGGHGGGGARWLELLILLAALAAAGWVVGRRSRVAGWLLGGTLAATVVAHAVASLAGAGVFERRYLSLVMPLGAGLLASAVASLPWRRAVPVAALVLVLAGVGVTATRLGREREPDYAAVISAVEATGGRTVLTNSPVVVYYLRAARLDRPFNLGSGDEQAARRPYAVVDDARVGYARPGPGRATVIDGRIVVRAVR